MLSDAARSVWGKSWPQGTPDIEVWNPLWRHLQDAAAVAGLLWDRWLPRVVRDQVAEAAGGETAGRALFVFLAGIHDIGKATPAFAVQVRTLRDQMVTAGLAMPHDIPPAERRRMPHSLAGQVVLSGWLRERYGWSAGEVLSIASVVGGHHGITPSRGEVMEAGAPRSAVGGETSTGVLLGTGEWERVQTELLDHMAAQAGAEELLAGTAWRSLPTPVLALALSVVVVADWLASNDALFPLTPVADVRPLAQPEDGDDARLDTAWRQVSLPAPWTVEQVTGTADELLTARFALPTGARARPVQVAAVEAARTMDPAGILVIEAPMGEGKTEAALLAAEVLAARSGAGGLLVALPTQATADAMFRRLMRWLARLSVDAAPQGDALVPDGETDARRSVFLAHGKAWLNPDYARVPHGASLTRDVGRDDGTGSSQCRLAGRGFGGAYVDGWMSGRRKGVLADFVVGTIDQVLFGSLQARHVALRHLALARKVVVLDEVHSFDAYMNVYMERALEWLGAYGVPVIALSATLQTKLRNRLVGAYRSGRESRIPKAVPVGAGVAALGWGRARPGGGEAAVGCHAVRAPEVPTEHGAGQPRSGGAAGEGLGSASALAPSRVVTALRGGQAISTPVPGESRSLRVRVERAADDPAAVAALVAEATAEGGCVLVVRNTVARAQETYRVLRSALGEEADVRLLHSRFLAADRKQREAALTAALGPRPVDGGGPVRPHRLVVVGTQVVEQSLDLDADLLVTDLAPTDLLLQRLGRLHRHERPASDRPPELREPRVVVVGVDDWASEPPTMPRGSVAVYGKHLLLRAAAQVRALVEDGDGTIVLPRDIAPLVQDAYGDGVLGAASWQDAMGAARAQDEAMRVEAESRAQAFRLPAPRASGDLVGWLDRSLGEADETGARAQVRDAVDSFEVLVVQRDEADQWRLPDWLGGKEARSRGELLPRGEVPGVSLRRALAGTSVRLPAAMARGKRGDAVLDELETLVVEAWQRSSDLAGQLVLPLDDTREALVQGFRVRYDPETGLSVDDLEDER
jgi:CRISPR-associated endonuclease Cas3-HD